MSTTTLHPHGVMGVPWTFAPKAAAVPIVMTWEPPPDFWCFSTYLLLRKEGTTTPVTDPLDVTATEVDFAGKGTRTTATLTDDPGSGFYVYSLFVVYDEWGDGTSLRYSPIKSATLANAANPGPDTPATPSTPTVFDVEWEPVPDFYSFRRYVVRRASGSTAPTGITDGTGVALIDETDVETYGVDDAPGSGTWAYAVFVTYDEFGTATDERVASVRTLERTI